MTSNASLESHMSQLSKTMVQLTQTNQAMATSQQQNQLALVTTQQQQANTFNTLAATTEGSMMPCLQLSPSLMAPTKKIVQYG